MGIKGLAKLLSDEAPDSIREVELKSLHGRKIAVDASMAIYQFLIAVRSGSNVQQSAAVMLTNAEGETTSHIQGIFNRTIRFLTEGIRPVFVFDGQPPQFKGGELAKRQERRTAAKAALETAKEAGDIAEQDKQSKRLVRAGRKENDDCKRLLKLMGVPIVEAPCEAEAQAAALCKSGLVYATATEDMDALTFGTSVLLRKMTFANASKSTIQEIQYDKAIKGLALTHAQFVDLCILLGCDYCDSIRGIGPKTALKLIRDYNDIETILKHIDRKKYTIPSNWIPGEAVESTTKNVKSKKKTNDDDDDDDDDQDEEGDKDENNSSNGEADDDNVNNDNVPSDAIPVYIEARRLFNEHDVLDNVELKWKPCQAEELTKFLVDEMGFSLDRVKNNIEKLQAAHKANTKPQMRMDNFFAIKPGTSANAKPTAVTNKRKSTEKSTPAKKGRGAKRR